MKDELISFETAKLAKEKGFNLCCINFYKKEKRNFPEYLTTGIDYDSNRDIEWDWNLLGGPSGNLVKIYPYPNNPKGEVYSAPTQSLLQRWLREVYNCYVEVIWHSPEDGSDVTKENIKFALEVNYYGKDFKRPLTEKADYQEYYITTYETALEKGLVEALKLIK